MAMRACDIHDRVIEIKKLRSSKRFTEADKVRGELRAVGVLIEVEADGSIFWWASNHTYNYGGKEGKRGIVRTRRLTEHETWAAKELLDRTYLFRKPLFLGKITIEGDPHFLPKDKLEAIYLGKGQWKNPK